MSAVLYVLAPLKTVTKRGGRPSSRWLSEAAVDAKRTRRRLERRWNSTGCEADRVAYRKACRHANLEITRSRQSFTQQRRGAENAGVENAGAITYGKPKL